MATRGLLIQCAQHYKSPTKRVGLVQSGRHYNRHLFGIPPTLFMIQLVKYSSFGVKQQSHTHSLKTGCQLFSYSCEFWPSIIIVILTQNSCFCLFFLLSFISCYHFLSPVAFLNGLWCWLSLKNVNSTFDTIGNTMENSILWSEFNSYIPISMSWCMNHP
jgi:hypothetical protein